jgi:hypothetical protein
MFQFSIKQWLSVFILCLLCCLGLWFWAKKTIFTPVQTENTTIMLEKIKTVTKLINVEGQFSELYNYNENYDYDFFQLFSKKIILRVTAKVSCGYDLEKMKMTIDSTQHTVTIEDMPKPTILSVDHDIDYYDISEGTFNEFTPTEYNTIQRKAKEQISKNPAINQLLTKSESQKDDYIKMLQIALHSAGWRLKVKSSNSTPL